VIIGLVIEAMEAGARLQSVCKELALHQRTVQRWLEQGVGEDRRAGPHHPPPNKLTSAERAKVLTIANAPEHRDLSPKQIVPRLADAGEYVASEATFYRILAAEGQLQHREPARAPVSSSRPDEFVAAGPNEVWTWDISYLRSRVKGQFFYLYAVLDVWSRKIVGWAVHEEESAEHARELVRAACELERIVFDQLVLHSDNGSPMRAATLLALLQFLGVQASFSRPGVSDDNPYSEALFRTAKYRPEYPRRPFASLEEARAWCESFVQWYNHEHLHSAIRFVTPAARHAGREVSILAQRHQVYQAARAHRPERWVSSTRNWTPIETVTLNPMQEGGQDEAA